MSLDISGSSAQDINDAPLRELSTNLKRLSVEEEADVNSKWRNVLSPVYEEPDCINHDDCESRTTTCSSKRSKLRIKTLGQKPLCRFAGPAFMDGHNSTKKPSMPSLQLNLSPGSVAKQKFLRRLEQRGLAYTEPSHLPQAD